MKSLKIIATPSSAGIFYMITSKIKGIDTVRASGFGTINELAERLPDALRSVPLVAVDDHPYQKHILTYFAGDMTALDNIPRYQSGTAFQEAVWRALDDIKPGKTLSYKQLAEKSGNAAAIRAAGTICGLNKLVLLVPCHRIIKSDGTVGSYLYGADVKRLLLSHENA